MLRSPSSLTAEAYRREQGASSGASVSVEGQGPVFSSCVLLRFGGKKALFAKEHRRSEIEGENRSSLPKISPSAQYVKHRTGESLRVATCLVHALPMSTCGASRGGVSCSLPTRLKKCVS